MHIDTVGIMEREHTNMRIDRSLLLPAQNGSECRWLDAVDLK